MKSDLAAAWRANTAVNYRLFDAIPGGGFAAAYSERTRTVAAQFAHLHNVRVYHLEKRAPHLLGELKTFARGAQPAKRALRGALKSSDAAIAALLAECGAAGRVKSWKGTPASYLAYFVAHEAHHRGLAIVALRLSGVKIPKDVLNDLWYLWRKSY